MKIWFVMYVLGHIQAVAGPLPYDMGECWSRAAEMSAIADTEFAVAGDESKAFQGRTLARRDVRFECQTSADKPEVGAAE